MGTTIAFPLVMMFLATPIAAASCGSSRSNSSSPGVRTMEIKTSGQKLNVYCDGKLRLAGGHPLFQPSSPSIKTLTETRDGFLFQTGSRPIGVRAQTSGEEAIVCFFLSPNGNQSESGKDFVGLFFDTIPEFDRGVTMWRYKPWNSWTKPVAIRTIGQMEEWDVQFFYWRYADGIYGAAMPLSGEGYRTTLGQDHGCFGSKSVSYLDKMNREGIPQMAIGFGADPFRLFERLYETGLKQMGCEKNLRRLKPFPEILEYIGWCTWNASDLGKNLNEDFLLRAARSFADAKFPIGWFLIDDGWFDQTGGKLNSFEPSKERFPRGFQSVISTLKQECHLRDVGVWHAMNGYWEGINPASALGEKYKSGFLSWKEKVHPEQEDSAWRTGTYLSPYSPLLPQFYNEFHQYLKGQGFSFIKVDNQLIVERMAVDNFPIWEGAERYHAALNNSVAATFGNIMINCMDMTADAYCNFGSTAVARAVEDYFPYEKGETYNLQRGNAAAHVLQAVYNSLYFSQMVYPDFDMFESGNPNAVFHAVARAINNGPLYITDVIGEQRWDVLFPLVYSDGRIIRSDTPLLPTEDCLFQVQEAKPFKAYSTVGPAGLLGIWNCADADRVEGIFGPSDVHPMEGNKFALYEHFTGKLTFADRNEKMAISLDRLACRLYYVLPLIDGNAAIGLLEKYNAPASVLRRTVTASAIEATVYEGGTFGAVGTRAPAAVEVDGARVPFRYEDRLILVNIPVTTSPTTRKVEIIFP